MWIPHRFGCLQTGIETLNDILGQLPKGSTFEWKKKTE